MIALCVGYFFYVREKAVNPNDTIVAIQVDKKFEQIKEQIESEYPATPKEVMQVYNELMGYAYCSSMKDQYIGDYVQDLRLLYSQELLERNTEEQQILAITAERITDVEKPLILIASNIEAVIKSQDNTSETKMEVEVKHSTNKGDILRTYHLVKENEKWKIDSWQDKK